MKQGILLAAGFSRRFGSNKLLQPLMDGVPLAVAAACRLRLAVPEILAVVNADAAELARLFEQNGVPVTVCPHAEAGMGASLAWAVSNTPHASAWIIALADMPLIQPATIAQVAAVLDDPIAIAVPVFQGQRGHPVGFGRAYFEALIRLNGDRGAQSLLQNHAERVQRLACHDPGTVMDIDAPADLDLLSRQAVDSTAVP